MAFYKIGLSANQLPEKFFIKDKDGLVPVAPADIHYVEAFDNYAKVFTRDQSYIVSHTLKSIESKLLPFGFERIHNEWRPRCDTLGKMIDLPKPGLFVGLDEKGRMLLRQDVMTETVSLIEFAEHV